MLHVFCFVFPQECHRLVKCHVIFLYKYGVKLFYVSSLQMLIKQVVLFFVFISLTPTLQEVTAEFAGKTMFFTCDL